MARKPNNRTTPSHTERVAPQRRHWPDGVYKRAQEILDQDPDATGAAVAAKLVTGRVRSPSAKTINDWLREGWIRRPDPSEIWSVREADADEARLVLPVLRALIVASHGEVTRVTRSQAAWIAKLRTIDPDIPERIVFELANGYVSADTTGGDTTDLDQYIAFEPWYRPGDGRVGGPTDYERTVKAGWIRGLSTLHVSLSGGLPGQKLKSRVIARGLGIVFPEDEQ